MSTPAYSMPMQIGGVNRELHSLVFTHLWEVDRSLAVRYRRRTKAPLSADGAPSLEDVVQFFKKESGVTAIVKVSEVPSGRLPSSTRSHSHCSPSPKHRKLPAIPLLPSSAESNAEITTGAIARRVARASSSATAKSHRSRSPPATSGAPSADLEDDMVWAKATFQPEDSCHSASSTRGGSSDESEDDVTWTKAAFRAESSHRSASSTSDDLADDVAWEKATFQFGNLRSSASSTPGEPSDDFEAKATHRLDGSYKCLTSENTHFQFGGSSSLGTPDVPHGLASDSEASCGSVNVRLLDDDLGGVEVSQCAPDVVSCTHLEGVHSKPSVYGCAPNADTRSKEQYYSIKRTVYCSQPNILARRKTKCLLSSSEDEDRDADHKEECLDEESDLPDGVKSSGARGCIETRSPNEDEGGLPASVGSRGDRRIIKPGLPDEDEFNPSNKLEYSSERKCMGPRWLAEDQSALPTGMESGCEPRSVEPRTRDEDEKLSVLLESDGGHRRIQPLSPNQDRHGIPNKVASGQGGGGKRIKTTSKRLRAFSTHKNGSGLRRISVKKKQLGTEPDSGIDDRGSVTSSHNERIPSSDDDDDDDDDELVPCDLCGTEWPDAQCPQHGPAISVPDTPVPAQSEPTQRAALSCPACLRVGPSAVHAGGVGVWTRRPLPAGLRFGPYRGRRVRDRARAARAGFSWEVVRRGRLRFCVDAADPARSNWMRFVNCAASRAAENMTAYQHRWRVFYRTARPVAAGEELLVYYGDEYRDELARERPPPAAAAAAAAAGGGSGL